MADEQLDNDSLNSSEIENETISDNNQQSDTTDLQNDSGIKEPGINDDGKQSDSNDTQNTSEINQTITGGNQQFADNISNILENLNINIDELKIGKIFGNSQNKDNKLISQKIRRDISVYKSNDEISEVSENLIKNSIICLAHNQGGSVWNSSPLHSLLIYLEDIKNCDYYYSRKDSFNLDDYLQNENNAEYKQRSVAYLNYMKNPREVESIFQSEYYKDLQEALKKNKLFLIVVLPLHIIEIYQPKNQEVTESIYCWIPKEKNKTLPEDVKILPDKPEEFIAKFLLAFFPGLDHFAFLYLFEKLLNEVAKPINNSIDAKSSDDSIQIQATGYTWKEDIDSLIGIQKGYYHYDKETKSEQKSGFYFSGQGMSLAVSEYLIKHSSIRVCTFSEVLTNAYLFDKKFPASITSHYHLFLKIIHDAGLRVVEGDWLAEKFCSSFDTETRDFTWLRVSELLEFLRIQALDRPVDDALDKIISWAVDIESTYLEIIHLNIKQDLIIESHKQRCQEIFIQLISVSLLIILLVRSDFKNNFNLLLKLLAGSNLRNQVNNAEPANNLSEITISCNAFYIQLYEISRDESFFYQFLEEISAVFLIPKIDIKNRANININNMLSQSKENRFFASAVLLRYHIIHFYRRAWETFLLDDSGKTKAFLNYFWCNDENPWQGAKVLLPVLYPKIELYGDDVVSNKTEILPNAIDDIVYLLELMISVRWKIDGKMIASKTEASESLVRIFCKDLTLREKTRVKQILSQQRERYRQKKSKLINDRPNVKLKDYRRRIEVLTRILSIFRESVM